MNKKIWKTAIYTRLSKEDKEKGQGNRILNQKELIKGRLQTMDDIEILLEIEDDGISGGTFNRDGFRRLMDEIKKGSVDCVVVKDLSRFGRNYLEVGDYIERIFPFMGVRFISLNDNYDSIENNSSVNDILIPFKNLINEAYLRDTSIKIKSQFEIKRKNGDFIGAFSPYGYKKSSDNKNKLVIDVYLKNVIVQMFKWKIEGYSHQKIAEKLNILGELPPYEYRQKNDHNYTTPFKKSLISKWQSGMVSRILQNPVYIGTLIQGMVETLNYKIRKVVRKPREEWITVENNHEPIIGKPLFNMVQQLMLQDTRVSPNEEKLYLLSSLLYCHQCGNVMCRKTVPSKSKVYYYWVCSKHKDGRGCSPHSFSENKMLKTVTSIINGYICNIININDVTYEENGQRIIYIKELIQNKDNEIKDNTKYKIGLYEDYKIGLLNKMEYDTYTDVYIKRLDLYKENLIHLNNELYDEYEKKIDKTLYNKALSRNLLLFLIERVRVKNKDEIEITFKFKDLFIK